MQVLIAWLNDNWLTIVSIILSGLISLVISACYYGKGNRSTLQMTMILPIINLFKDQYSVKNYYVLSDLSKNYCVRYLTKKEKRLLSQLIFSYKVISRYSTINMNANILFSYFEYVLKKNDIEAKPCPFIHEGEILYYEYPPDLFYLNSDLEHVLNKYDPDFEPKECQEALLSLFIAYSKKEYGISHLQFFNDYDLKEVLAKSKIKKDWDSKFEEIDNIKNQFFDLKVVKELVGKQINN